MVWMILSSLIVYLVLQPYQVSWDAFQINRYVRLVRLHRAATYFFRSNKNSWHCVCLKAIEWRLRRFFKHSPDQELTWVTSESEWQDDCQCDIIQLTKSKMKIFSMKRSTIPAHTVPAGQVLIIPNCEPNLYRGGRTCIYLPSSKVHVQVED